LLSAESYKVVAVFLMCL